MKLPDRRLPRDRLSGDRLPGDRLPGNRLPRDITPPVDERLASVHPNTVRELEELIIKAFYLAHDIAGLAQQDRPQLHNLNSLTSMVLRQWAIAQGTAIDATKGVVTDSRIGEDVKKFG
jgi:myo-inositol catabolism protein IolC